MTREENFSEEGEVTHLDNENEIDKELFRLFNLIRQVPSEYAFFIGAGASVSAGIPLGDFLRDEVLHCFYGMHLSSEELLNSFNKEFRLDNKQCPTLEVVNHFFLKKHGMSVLKILEKEILKCPSPPTGFENLKEICVRKKIKNIITVNFDELLETAFTAISKVILGIDETVSFDPSSNSVNILKLHGTISSLESLCASTESVAELSSNKKNLLKKMIGNSNIIFVGYSARDADVIGALRECANLNLRFYLVSPEKCSFEQQRMLKISNSENNHIALKSDAFLYMLKNQLLGGDEIETPIEQALKKCGHDVVRVIWKPGPHEFNGSWIDTIEVIINKPNAIPKSGPIEAAIGNAENDDVVRLSQHYYPSSQVWVTWIISEKNSTKIRCKCFEKSIKKYNIGGTSSGGEFPEYLKRYLTKIIPLDFIFK